MKKNSNFIRWCMRHYQITLLAISLLVIFGIVALKVMPKQEFPEFTIRQGIVFAVYPGASSSEIEKQVAKPLERYIYTFKEVKKRKCYSVSKNGMLYMMVELNDEVNNKDEVWSKIKLGLQTFKQQLPVGVLALAANDDFGDTSALLITLESEDKTYRELEDYLEDLEDRLRRIESVSNARRYGVQKEQISIYVDPNRMAAYGMNTKQLMSIFFTQGFTTTSGTLENETLDMPIHVSNIYRSEKEIAEQILIADSKGNIIRLKDIARIVREYPKDDSYIINNGCKAIILSIEMREGYNIVEYGRQVDKVLAEFGETLPTSVSIRRIADQPKIVDDSVTSFIRDLFISIAVVILVMMILFPFRSAIVSATSIPISIFISIGLMYLFGIPLNTVTLAALIVVLGMIVDNSIIVIDGYLERLDRGMSRWHAAISSAKDYFSSIFVATLSICIIFYPLLFTMSGQKLDFLRFFPWTITISLMTSLAIAMVFIPILEHSMIRQGLKNAPKKKTSFNMLDVVQRVYNKTLTWTFRWPKVTIFIGMGSVALGIFIFTLVPARMMPHADRDQFAVEIYLPQGTPLKRTATVSDSLYHILKQDKRIHSVTCFIGCASPRFQATYSPNMGGKNYAQFIINTSGIKDTKQILDEYTDIYADYFPNAYIKFKQLDYQDVACPLEIRFKGDDIAHLKQCADSLTALLRREPELVWVHTNYEELQPDIRVKLNSIEASRLGISKTTAATGLALHYGEIQAGTLWEDDYPLEITLQTEKKSKYDAFCEIGDVYIPTAIPGTSVPLRQIANVEAGYNDGQIVRRNGIRCLSVLAQVKRGANEAASQKRVEAIMNNQIIPNLPKGISYEYGGALESDNEIITPIILGISIAIAIVFFFLLINFKKIGLALACLASLSLTLFGAAFGLWISGLAFSITCVLGIISLIGIVVRNAIMIFDHAQDLRVNKRYSAQDAAFDAGKRRMLPIFLTSATTAVGVIPMIISGSSLWAPMGVIICSGTIFSMILAVIILPVFYWKIFPEKKV